MLMVIYLLMAGIGLSIVQSHIKLIECKLNLTPQQCNESIFNSRLPIPAFFGIISSNQSDSLVNNDQEASVWRIISVIYKNLFIPFKCRAR